jgi:hypothetical protein
MKPLHSTILASFGGVLAALGMASTAFAVLRPLGGLLYFAGTAVLVGGMAFPEEKRPVRWTFGLMGALALTSVFGSLVYYAYKLDAIGLSWLLIALPWVVFAFTPFARSRRNPDEQAATTAVEKTAPEDSLSAVLLVLAVLSDAAALRWLAGARTAEAIRTPWEAVPMIFFLWIALATVCLAALAYRKRYPHLALAAASLHLFTLLAPAAVVYAIGYGFDPFVHQAAERLVAASGQITPKTPYYVGQYALVTVISRIFRLATDGVDRFLLPAMTALFLPAAAAWLLRRGFGVARGLALIGATGVFLLPLGSFVSTTPQGVANLFFLLTVLVGAAWLHAHRPPLGFVLALAAASAAAHPLAGIPALFAAALLMAAKLRHDGLTMPRISKAIVFGIILGGAALAVPLAFSLREGTGSLPIEAAFRKPVSLIENVPFEAPGLETRYRPLLDFAEFVDRNYDVLWFLMAGAGAWLLARRKHYRRSALALGGLSVALLAGSSIVRTGFTFQDVIGYEQGNYAARLYEAALLAAAPLVLAAFAWWWRALAKTDAAVRFLMALVFAATVAALAYGAFPRLDDYRFSRGYSTSAHDVEAVRWINTHAIGNYVVLANQSVSAAALREYGFRTYYGDQFYYAIPTGAPLYQRYLEMVYDAPSRATMDAAMRDVGVAQAYFVVNDYWTDAPRIIEAAKKTADDWQDVDGGKVFIFRYTLR